MPNAHYEQNHPQVKNGLMVIPRVIQGHLHPPEVKQYVLKADFKNERPATTFAHLHNDICTTTFAH